MDYNIYDSKEPLMPRLGKGAEPLKNLLSITPKELHPHLFSSLCTSLACFFEEVKFIYPSGEEMEMAGMMTVLVAESGGNKGQMKHLVDEICGALRLADDEQHAKYAQWQKEAKRCGSNKEKPEEPDRPLQYPPANMTMAAFLKNALALEAAGNKTMLVNVPEIEMLYRMCGGKNDLSEMMRNIHDSIRAGALRATADGVSGNPTLRVNITASTTQEVCEKFFEKEVKKGTLGRVHIALVTRAPRNGKIPKKKPATEQWRILKDEYVERIKKSKGIHTIVPLNTLIKRLAEDMADLANLSDDDVLHALPKRALIFAWKCGCVMWVLNHQQWTRAMAEIVEWLVYHNLWAKVQLFGHLFQKKSSRRKKKRSTKYAC